MAKKVRLFTRQEWLLLGLCILILGSTSNPTIGFKMFLPVFILEFDWSLATISGIFIVFPLIRSLSGILMGWLSDRYDTRRIILAGAIIAALGLALSSLTQSLWHLYLLFGVVVGAGFGAFHVPVFAFIQRSFSHRRGLATAIAAQGQGILLISAWLPFLLVHTGWRAGLIIQGGLVLALILPLAYLLKPPSMAEPEKSEVDPSALLMRGTDNPTRSFGDGKRGWVFAVFASGIGSSYCRAILSVHLVSISSEFGFTPQKGMLALGFTLGLGSLIGTIGCGLLSDRFGAKWPLFASIVLVTIPIPLILGASLPDIFFLSVMLLGMGTGGLFTAYPVLLRDLFGPKHIGLFLGIILFGSNIAVAFSAYVTGQLHDATGSYTIPFLLSFFIGVIALFLVWFIPNQRDMGSSLASEGAQET